MAKKRSDRRRRAADLREPEDTVVVVCRGGDCGSRRKHPELDHLEQLRQIRADLAKPAVAVTSRCLDACEHSNVIVVIPGAAARDADPRSVWVGQVNDLDSTDDLVQWVNAGGPGGAPAPALVDILQFTPTRQSRRELEGGAVLPLST